MTAKGKINASSVQISDRIIVQVSGISGKVSISQTKTGEGVQVARVVGKTSALVRDGYARKAIRVHRISTSAGDFEAYGVETMWLAPEDVAGIKRARIEADAEESYRESEAALATQAAEHAAWLDAQVQAALTLNSQDGKVSDMDNDASTEAPALITQANDTEVMDAALAKLTETAPAATPVTGDMTGSAVVELLETVWDRIRQNHPQLPAVVIVTGSGLLGGSKWGHFRRDGWKVQAQGEGAATSGNLDEMFMAGETLAKGARQVLQTMLHEGAHTLAKVREIQDTSRQGRWHNAKFRELAEEMGLEHKAASADKAIGFSFVTLKAETVEQYADLLTELDAAIRLVCHLPAWLGGSDEDDKGGETIGKKPPTTEPTKSTKLTCKCDEPNIIRASKKVAEKLIVRCDDCEALFRDRG